MGQSDTLFSRLYRCLSMRQTRHPAGNHHQRQSKSMNHKFALVARRRRMLAHRSLVRTTFVSGHGFVAHFTALCSQVLMIFRPAGRFLTIPFPPDPFAARRFAAVILPPRLFFAIMNPFCCYVLVFVVVRHVGRRAGPCLWGITLP